jgi:hypothetical protein
MNANFGLALPPTQDKQAVAERSLAGTCFLAKRGVRMNEQLQEFLHYLQYERQVSPHTLLPIVRT